MDTKKALELVNQLITDHKRTDLKGALDEFFADLKQHHVDPLKKSINDAQEGLNKIDPTSKLPGTLLDKGGQMGEMGAMQSNLNPEKGADQSSGFVKADPATSAPMLGSEGKKDWKGFMGKCMKALTSSESLDKGKKGLGTHGAAKPGVKGVHQPPSKLSAEMGISNAPGDSKAGFHAQMGAARNGRPASPEFASNAREMHGDKLKELKQMPKPNLPKTEKAEDCPKKSKVTYGMIGVAPSPALEGQAAVSAGSVQKDDKPHAAGSPQDKAHDIVEEGQSVGQAVGGLNSEGLQTVKKMFEHLRSKKGNKNWERSPENQEVGKSEEKPENDKGMSKDAEKAIMVSADQPIKIQEHRPGQANKPSKE